MKFLAGVAALASLAAAAPSGAPTPLDVKLEAAGNSGKVKATVTNNGKNDLKIFRPGTIFDNASTEKATVSTEGGPVNFDGVRLRLDTENLTDEDFEKIAAGQSVEVTFDLAETHDLSAGGKYTMTSTGVLSFSDAADNKLIGSVPYQSNSLQAEIDGAVAAATRRSVMARHAKRTHVQSDCTGSRGSATRSALSNCVKLANAAKKVAQSGSASKMEEFFKSSSSSTRNTVANVLTKVASECGSTSGGASDYYCTDVANHCGNRVLAYTVPSQSYMAYCDIYFDNLPGLTSSCHRQDQATTTLHEMTHLQEVAGTRDLGYGYDNIQKLSTRDSLNNADSYAVFANSIYAGC
ncbi:hypothetical protein K4F52_004380 [Lecanicillium sp. MT-2017a]|nr:hypothetical protein K4F52_004380 [Lecanicillium sp. MT-2017a]